MVSVFLTHAVPNWTFSSPVISGQNTGGRLHFCQRECWFEIASSCFGEFPFCFEVCTPLSVLTLTQRATTVAIYTSCGRIGFPHVTDLFLNLFYLAEDIPRIQPCCIVACRSLCVNWRPQKNISDNHKCFCFVIFHSCWGSYVYPRRLPCGKALGSQSESPNQCISYNSHSLLILPLKFMLLFSETPCCGPHCLPNRRVTTDTRVLGQMPSDPFWCTSASKSHIHRHERTISQDLNEIPHTKPKLPALPALPLAVFFSFFLFYHQQQV